MFLIDIETFQFGFYLYYSICFVNLIGKYNVSIKIANSWKPQLQIYRNDLRLAFRVYFLSNTFTFPLTQPLKSI